MQNHWQLVQNLVQKNNYKCKILIISINHAKRDGNMHKTCINIHANITNINLFGIEFAPKKAWGIYRIFKLQTNDINIDFLLEYKYLYHDFKMMYRRI